MRRTLFSALLLSLLVVAGCENGSITATPLTPDSTSALLTGVEGVVEVVGETGPGSTYALFLPDDWNGALVIWAHGYIQPFLPVQLPAAEPEHLGLVRDHVLEEGFAFAYSSYSESGYAVKDGAQRTHQLRGLFAAAFEAPARTYLIGISMGGLVAEQLSERHPAQYDGTLAACPLLSGPANAAYIAHFRVLFDWLFQDPSGASPLPGSLYSMPDGYYLIPPGPGLPYGSPAFQAVVGAVTANPGAAVALASTEHIALEFESPTELVTSFVHALGYQINGANALTARLKGHGFFDNSNTLYSSPFLDSDAQEALNDPVSGVQRYESEPAGVNYMEHWWEPQGKISRPFLTLHTTRDPLVPFWMEERFRSVVEAAGNEHLLVQRPVEGFGHCAYGSEALVEAFHDLVSWVEEGVKPSS